MGAARSCFQLPGRRGLDLAQLPDLSPTSCSLPSCLQPHSSPPLKCLPPLLQRVPQFNYALSKKILPFVWTDSLPVNFSLYSVDIQQNISLIFAALNCKSSHGWFLSPPHGCKHLCWVRILWPPFMILGQLKLSNNKWTLVYWLFKYGYLQADIDQLRKAFCENKVL